MSAPSPPVPAAAEQRAIQCCIAGCGPAGALLGLLLARAGVEVLVLEKHADFLRDFRGDTVHPSTLEILDQIGLADKVLELRHTRATSLSFQAADGEVVVADFSRLPSRFPFIAFLPQWDLLNLLTREAQRYPRFHLLMNAEAVDLIEQNGVVRGLRYRDAKGLHDVQTPLVVAADGRDSRIRTRAGLKVKENGAPMDVLWLRVSRHPTERVNPAVRMGHDNLLILINRFEYWQLGYVIPKGSADRLRAAGLATFKESLAALAPDLSDALQEVTDWQQIKLLTVQSNRLLRWYRPGLLCIGDAAHAMTPVGGVGINMAMQDAAVTANLLAGPLRSGTAPLQLLRQVQRRRELPVRLVQGFQGILQQRFMTRASSGGGPSGACLALGALRVLPALRALPAWLIAYGPARVKVTSELLTPRP